MPCRAFVDGWCGTLSITARVFADLRRHCREHGVSPAGNRENLQERLCEALGKVSLCVVAVSQVDPSWSTRRTSPRESRRMLDEDDVVVTTLGGLVDDIPKFTMLGTRSMDTYYQNLAMGNMRALSSSHANAPHNPIDVFAAPYHSNL